LASDYEVPLQQDLLKETIVDLLRKSSDMEAALKQIKPVFQDAERQTSVMAPPKTMEIMNALVPFVGHDALANAPGRFDPNSVHVIFVTKLAGSLGSESRYQLLNAIADQIRYPNTHTDFFCKLMLHLWGSGNGDAQQGEIREQISRIVYERLAVARPHVWGMTILFLELQNNLSYGFWETVAPDSNMQQRLQQAMRTIH
jgi:CCR4-NOT transcription complex subunit 1